MSIDAVWQVDDMLSQGQHPPLRLLCAGGRAAQFAAARNSSARLAIAS